jgi:hypothetical protein
MATTKQIPATDTTGARPTTKRLRAFLIALLALATPTLAACAGEPMASSGASVAAGAPPTPPPPPVAAAYGGGPAVLAPSPMAPLPESRPGLATEWGEERESRIHDVDFTRADPTRPLATTELRYDDARGVGTLAATLGARADRAYRASLAGGVITMWLEDGGHHPLAGLDANGHTLVVGEQGERYSIFVENHTGLRFEAVATVDGLDVMNGQPGSVANRGYVLQPYATLEIDGFRKSEDAVAAFRFGRVGSSYAARRGDDRNVGVIGVAFFHEAGDEWAFRDGALAVLPGEARRRAAATPFPADRFAPPPTW